MRDFQARRRIKRITFSWFTLSVLLIVNIFLVRANYLLYEKERYTLANETQAQKEYDDAVSRQKSLNAEVARLNTSEGIDLELRRKFQVVKPGEETVVIVSSAATTSELLPEKTSLWQNVTHWFGW